MAAALAFPVLLSACAAPERTGAQLGDAVVTPLTDLNLQHKDIPAVLRDARAKPYGRPVPGDCAGMRGELASLDDVLGPDLDAPVVVEGTADRLGNAAGSALVGAVARTAEGVIPMRGWVRKLSGAERRQAEIQAATQAGMVRRGFLRGMLASGTCA